MVALYLDFRISFLSLRPSLADEDRYFHLAASSVPLPFVLPVVLALSSSSSYLILSSLVGALLAVRSDS